MPPASAIPALALLAFLALALLALLAFLALALLAFLALPASAIALPASAIALLALAFDPTGSFFATFVNHCHFTA